MGLRSSKTARKQIGADEAFPDGVVYEAYPEGANVSLKELLRGKPIGVHDVLRRKRTLLLGAPGAFTPNCSGIHLPGYVAHADQFLAAGAEQIVCLTANDVFVTQQWSDQLGAKGKVRILADPTAAVAHKLGLALDCTSTLGRHVYRRFACMVDDCVVTHLWVEEDDGLGVRCSAAAPVLSSISTSPRLGVGMPRS